MKATTFAIGPAAWQGVTDHARCYIGMQPGDEPECELCSQSERRASS